MGLPAGSPVPGTGLAEDQARHGGVNCISSGDGSSGAGRPRPPSGRRRPTVLPRRRPDYRSAVPARAGVVTVAPGEGFRLRGRGAALNLVPRFERRPLLMFLPQANCYYYVLTFWTRALTSETAEARNAGCPAVNAARLCTFTSLCLLTDCACGCAACGVTPSTWARTRTTGNASGPAVAPSPDVTRWEYLHLSESYSRQIGCQ